jgi:hypothetical protein
VTTTSTRYVASNYAVMQSGPDGPLFTSTFDTDGLKPGKYKVEVTSALDPKGGTLSSSSVNQLMVNLIGDSAYTATQTINTPVPSVVNTRVPTTEYTTPSPDPVSSASIYPLDPSVTDPLTPTTTIMPAPASTPVESKPTLVNNGQEGMVAGVSILIALGGFGLIEYSVTYWKNKKSK